MPLLEFLTALLVLLLLVYLLAHFVWIRPIITGLEQIVGRQFFPLLDRLEWRYGPPSQAKRKVDELEGLFAQAEQAEANKRARANKPYWDR